MVEPVICKEFPCEIGLVWTCTDNLAFFVLMSLLMGNLSIHATISSARKCAGPEHSTEFIERVITKTHVSFFQNLLWRSCQPFVSGASYLPGGAKEGDPWWCINMPFKLWRTQSSKMQGDTITTNSLNMFLKERFNQHPYRPGIGTWPLPWVGKSVRVLYCYSQFQDIAPKVLWDRVHFECHIHGVNWCIQFLREMIKSALLVDVEFLGIGKHTWFALRFKGLGASLWQSLV